VAGELEGFAGKILPVLKRLAPAAAIETTHLGSVPAFSATPGSEAVALALSLTGANAPRAVSYATEAGLFEQAGFPTVICGPGDIEQAHAADEFVSPSELQSCLSFLAKLADRLSA
jgi:acetylornithine deacetylase